MRQSRTRAFNDDDEDDYYQESEKKESYRFAGKKMKKQAGLSEYKQAVKGARINFAEIQTTGEYMEMHYFSQKTTPHDTQSRVPSSQFFSDYA